MYTALRILFCTALMLSAGEAGVSQNPPAPLTPSVRQRVEALLRSRIELPPATTLSFTEAGPSELPGFEKLSAHYSSSFAGAKGDISLLISKDGTRIAQLSTFDIAADPKTKVPFNDRPARGGPATAPVIVVGFDDLECPFCAQFHKELFPALTDHYKDQVHVVYQSLPNTGHPWAMHAAIDTDCLSQQSASAYWSAVDAIHEHAAEYGGAERKLVVANEELDVEASEEGRRFHLNEEKLKACIRKQDPAPENASVAIASKVGVERTPTFFVNGAKFEGVVPIEFVFDMVDNALRAEGQTPPPRQRVAIQQDSRVPNSAQE